MEDIHNMKIKKIYKACMSCYIVHISVPFDLFFLDFILFYIFLECMLLSRKCQMGFAVRVFVCVLHYDIM